MQCSVCHKQITSNSKYQNHIVMCDECYNKTCNLCGKQFGNPERKKKHIKNLHNKNRQFACTYCSCRLGTLTSLRCHITKEHPESSEAKKRRPSITDETRSHETEDNQQGMRHIRDLSVVLTGLIREIRSSTDRVNETNLRSVLKQSNNVNKNKKKVRFLLDEPDSSDEQNEFPLCPYCKEPQPSATRMAGHILNQHEHQ